MKLVRHLLNESESMERRRTQRDILQFGQRVDTLTVACIHVRLKTSWQSLFFNRTNSSGVLSVRAIETRRYSFPGIVCRV